MTGKLGDKVYTDDGPGIIIGSEIAMADKIYTFDANDKSNTTINCAVEIKKDQHMDLCHHCIARGNIEKCLSTKCNMHKSLILKKEAEIYKSALEHFGGPSQITKTIEECAELITALCHHRISRASKDDVCSELADVEIMLAQMRLFFGAEDVERMKQKKISRLAEMIGLQTAISG